MSTTDTLPSYLMTHINYRCLT